MTRCLRLIAILAIPAVLSACDEAESEAWTAAFTEFAARPSQVADR